MMPLAAQDVRGWRLSHGLTQEAAARLCGVVRRTWIRWEHGQAVPSPMAMQGIRALMERMAHQEEAT